MTTRPSYYMNTLSSRKRDYLQEAGLLILAFFFFMYTAGSVYGQEDAYSIIFDGAIVIALAMLLRGAIPLWQYKGYYKWQGLFIAFLAFTLLYTPSQHPDITQMFKLVFKTTTVAIICKDFNGVRKLLLYFAFVGLGVFFVLYRTGSLFVVGRLGNDLVGNANTLGLIYSIYFVGAFTSISLATNKYLKIVLIVSSILDLLVLILTGGRKFLLFASVFVYVSFLLTTKQKMSKIIPLTILFAILVVLLAYLIMTVDVFYDAIGYRFDGMSSGQAEGVDTQSDLMKKGIDLFLKKPLFGWGIQGYQAISGTGFYSHSNYVELLCNFGLFGTILYYSQLISCWFIMFKNQKYAGEEIKIYLPLLSAIFVIDIFSISFNQTAFIPLFVMLISGFCYRLSHNRILTQ